MTISPVSNTNSAYQAPVTPPAGGSPSASGQPVDTVHISQAAAQALGHDGDGDGH
jgi:hypothetical protein